MSALSLEVPSFEQVWFGRPVSEEWIVKLQTNDLFAGVRVEAVHRFAAKFFLARLPRRSVLFRASDPPRRFFLVLEGLVRIDGANARGKELILGYRRENSFVGEGAVALGARRERELTARCLEATLICSVEASVVRQLCLEVPEVSYNLAHVRYERLAPRT